MSGPKSGNWCLVPAGSGGGTHTLAEMQQIMKRHGDKIQALEQRLRELGVFVQPASLEKHLDRATNLDMAWAERSVAELNRRAGVYNDLREAVAKAEAEAEEAKAQERARARAEAERARIATEVARREAEKARIAAENALRERERLARVETLNARAAELVEQRAAREAQETQKEIERQVAFAERVFHDVARLSQEAGEDLRRELEALAKSCIDEEGVDRRSLIAKDIKVRVDKANRMARDVAKRAQEQMAAYAQEAQEALIRLADLGAPARGKLNHALYAVMDGDARFDDELRLKVKEALRAAEKVRATEILKETLEELGYAVGEEFETAFADGGNTFQRPEWGEYHCQLSLDAELQRASVLMLRQDDGPRLPPDEQMELDREMEETWCSELPKLLDRLREKNVQIDLHRRMAPGAFPVQVSTRALGSKTKRKSDTARINSARTIEKK